MLFLWLLGIGAGFANACIAAVQVAPVAAAASHLVAVADAHHDERPRDHAQADGAALLSHSDDRSAHLGTLSKANCQYFCDEATVSIPPLKSVLDDIQPHAVTAIRAMTVLPMSAFAPVQLRVPCRNGVPAPPIPIAFLRLAL